MTTKKKIDVSELIQQARQLADGGQPSAALELLGFYSQGGLPVMNAQAVCWLRMGRAAQALSTYRQFIFSQGGIFMKRDLPVHFRTNFVTALLLNQLPNGARDSLAEIDERKHPSVLRLKQAIGKWEQQMSVWQYVNWKLGVAPRLPITLDFQPGEFVDPVTDSEHPPLDPKAPQPGPQHSHRSSDKGSKQQAA